MEKQGTILAELSSAQASCMMKESEVISLVRCH
jgi:hypothetical protein